MRGISIKSVLCDRANNANNLNTERASNVVNPNTVTNATGMIYYAQINGDTSPNLPQMNGWQNSLIDLGLHSSGLGAQIYISKDFFLRVGRNASFQKIMHEGNINDYIKKYLDSQ